MNWRAVLPLAGEDWRIAGFVGDEWRWKKLTDDEPSANIIWHAARVPGSVIDDLARAGAVADPYYDRNSLQVEWVPQRTWVYRRTFRVDASLARRRATLVFEGIDYEAEVFLNGEVIGTHRGMFTLAIFDVTDRLRLDRENVLVVAIAPAPEEEPQVGRTERVRTHKTRMNYGWDFCPRLVHQGLWDDARLEFTGPTRIADVWVRPIVTEDHSCADIEVRTTLDGPDIGVALEIQREGAIVASGAGADARVRIDRPELWWPNGHGAQPLYQCVVRAGGSDERRVTFGIRQVELAANDTPDRSARPYVFVVNRRRVYVNGWNWVPLDALYGADRPQQLARLIELARRAHVNLFRVWGGGLIEREAFYEACDRAGIMVWQEFVQSSSGLSSQPSRDPAFVEMLRREAEVIVPRKRNHPSLVAWCGGNELADNDSPLTEDRSPVLAALRDVVRSLDPDRAWFPSSPSGPTFANSAANITAHPDALHDVHGPWEHQGLEGQSALYDAGTSLFHSEFGAEGMTNREAIEATLPREQRWPVTRQNPMWAHRGDWWINEPLLRTLFGPIDDLETLRRCSQYLQAQGLAYAVESNRRRQWRNSGSIPWQFDEPYPNGWCTSAVDYFGRPKPAYHAVQHAYAPMLLSASFPTLAWGGRDRFTAVAWASNAGTDFTAARLEWRLTDALGTVHARGGDTIDIPAPAATRLLEIEHPLAIDEVFFLDLELHVGDLLLAPSRYIFSPTTDLAPLLRLPLTSIAVRVSGEDALVSNRGRTAAIGIELYDARPARAAGFLFVEPNYLSLLPGEQMNCRVEWWDVPERERRLGARVWNAPDVVVDLAGRLVRP